MPDYCYLRLRRFTKTYLMNIQSIKTYQYLQKNTIFYLLLILFLFTVKVTAQNDTIFFDRNWKISTEEAALYYRLKPQKIKTKDAIGYKIENCDSLFIIQDYYLKNNTLEFKGYSKDQNGNDRAGKAKWYDESGKVTDFYNYKKKFDFEFFPEWPIIYAETKIASKFQFTMGLEVCLMGSKKEDDNKLFFGLGYGITNYDKHVFGVPDIHLSYNVNSMYWPVFCKIGASNRHAYALTGLTFFNALDLGIGYSFPFEKQKTPEIKGPTLGIVFRFSKNDNIFTSMKLF